MKIVCKDPLDVRPAADAIMVTIERSRAAMEADRPLIIIMGENHEIPAHKALQQLILRRLKQRAVNDNSYIPAYGFEDDYNRLENILEESFGLTIPADLKGRISRNDKDGRRTIQSYLSSRCMKQAPVSTWDILNFCLTEGVSLQFNDVSRRKIEYQKDMVQSLDPFDPFTRDIISEYDADAMNFNICTTSTLGMSLRNRGIVKNVKRHLNRTPCGVYVQHTGGIHVFGKQPLNPKDIAYPYNDSLTALFQKEGFETISILPYDTDTLPYDIELNLISNSILINGLNDTTFDDFNQIAEAGHLNKIFQSSGMPAFNLVELSDAMTLAKRNMKQYVEEAATGLSLDIDT